ncbi:MAG: VCBS repeat-containing protein [Myxococcota bacterium]
MTFRRLLALTTLFTLQWACPSPPPTTTPVRPAPFDAGGDFRFDAGTFRGDGGFRSDAGRPDAGAACTPPPNPSDDAGTTSVTPVFHAMPTISVSTVRALALGDVNGDGHLDLVTLEASSTLVQSRLGDGEGGFQVGPAQALTGGTALALADVNRDGVLDVVATRTGFLELLHGDGLGGFTGVRSVALSSQANQVLVEDFNGDVFPDVAVADSANGLVMVLLSDEEGPRGPVLDNLVPGLQRMTSGDFNGDGRADLAVSETLTGSVRLLQWNGNGFSQSSISTAVASATSLAAADFNRDGRTDVVTFSYDDKLALLMSQPHAPLAPVNHYCLPRTTTPLVADFNNDARPDLWLGADDGGESQLLLGHGDGTFHVVTAAASGLSLAAAADLNHDGTTDLVAVRTDTLAVLLNTPVTRTVRMAPLVRISLTSGAQSLDVADLDHNGVLDLVTAGPGTGAVELRLGTPGTGWTDAHVLNTDTSPYVVRTANLSDDGRTELLVAAPGGLQVWQRNVQDVYQPLPGFAASAETPVRMLVAELTGDAFDDVAVLDHARHEVVIHVGNEDGVPADTIRHVVGQGPSDMVTLDLNRDGYLDLVVANADENNLGIFRGGPDGLQASEPLELTSRPLALATGDIHGNGVDDVAVALPDADVVTVFVASDGALSSGGQVEVTGRPSAVALRDMDLDGRLDLAVASFSSGLVHVLLGNGAGGFTLTESFTAPANPTTITAADLNRDGMPDLAIGGIADDEVGLVLSTP